MAAGVLWCSSSCLEQSTHQSEMCKLLNFFILLGIWLFCVTCSILHAVTRNQSLHPLWVLYFDLILYWIQVHKIYIANCKWAIVGQTSTASCNCMILQLSTVGQWSWNSASNAGWGCTRFTNGGCMVAETQLVMEIEVQSFTTGGCEGFFLFMPNL